MPRPKFTKGKSGNNALRDSVPVEVPRPTIQTQPPRPPERLIPDGPEGVEARLNQPKHLEESNESLAYSGETRKVYVLSDLKTDAYDLQTNDGRTDLYGDALGGKPRAWDVFAEAGCFNESGDILMPVLEQVLGEKDNFMADPLKTVYETHPQLKEGYLGSKSRQTQTGDLEQSSGEWVVEDSVDQGISEGIDSSLGRSEEVLSKGTAAQKRRRVIIPASLELGSSSVINAELARRSERGEVPGKKVGPLQTREGTPAGVVDTTMSSLGDSSGETQELKPKPSEAETRKNIPNGSEENAELFTIPLTVSGESSGEGTRSGGVSFSGTTDELHNAGRGSSGDARESDIAGSNELPDSYRVPEVTPCQSTTAPDTYQRSSTLENVLFGAVMTVGLGVLGAIGYYKKSRANVTTKPEATQKVTKEKQFRYNEKTHSYIVPINSATTIEFRLIGDKRGREDMRRLIKDRWFTYKKDELPVSEKAYTLGVFTSISDEEGNIKPEYIFKESPLPRSKEEPEEKTE